MTLGAFGSGITTIPPMDEVFLPSLTSYFARSSASASESTFIAACGWRTLIARMASALSGTATCAHSCSGDAPPGFGITVTITTPRFSAIPPSPPENMVSSNRGTALGTCKTTVYVAADIEPVRKPGKAASAGRLGHGSAMAQPVYLQQRTNLVTASTAVECQNRK